MRSVINLPSKEGIAAVVAQQFDVAARIAKHGLMPIIEPEVSIKSPDKAGAEAILLGELTRPGIVTETGFERMTWSGKLARWPKSRIVDIGFRLRSSSA
jgi:hypothetical protein